MTACVAIGDYQPQKVLTGSVSGVPNAPIVVAFGFAALRLLPRGAVADLL
jgi:hypothetical protein